MTKVKPRERKRERERQRKNEKRKERVIYFPFYECKLSIWCKNYSVPMQYAFFMIFTPRVLGKAWPVEQFLRYPTQPSDRPTILVDSFTPLGTKVDLASIKQRANLL